MAFIRAGFSRVAALGVIGTDQRATKSLCTHHTNDDAAAVETAGYFNALAGEVTKGDFILACLDLDGTPAAKLYLVTAVAGGVVTVAGVLVS